LHKVNRLIPGRYYIFTQYRNHYPYQRHIRSVCGEYIKEAAEMKTLIASEGAVMILIPIHHDILGGVF